MTRITSIIIFTLLLFSCTDFKQNNYTNQLQTEIDSLKKSIIVISDNTKGQIATFLTFQEENAEQAMDFYVELFDNSGIIDIKRWGEGSPSEEGTIMHATFRLNGNLYMCSDSPPIHDWDFTPAFSNYVECSDDIELDRLFSKLSENGKVMMPLGNYGFSQKFGFVEDQFGVSWQLNLQ